MQRTILELGSGPGQGYVWDGIVVSWKRNIHYIRCESVTVLVGVSSKRNEDICPHKFLYTNVYSGFLRISLKLKKGKNDQQIVYLWVKTWLGTESWLSLKVSYISHRSHSFSVFADPPSVKKRFPICLSLLMFFKLSVSMVGVFFVFGW